MFVFGVTPSVQPCRDGERLHDTQWCNQPQRATRSWRVHRPDWFQQNRSSSEVRYVIVHRCNDAGASTRDYTSNKMLSDCFLMQQRNKVGEDCDGTRPQLDLTITTAALHLVFEFQGLGMQPAHTVAINVKYSASLASFSLSYMIVKSIFWGVFSD